MAELSGVPTVGDAVATEDGVCWLVVKANEITKDVHGILARADFTVMHGVIYKTIDDALAEGNLYRLTKPEGSITPPPPDDHTYLRLRPTTVGFSIPGRSGDRLEILHLSDDNDYTPPPWTSPDYWATTGGGA